MVANLELEKSKNENKKAEVEEVYQAGINRAFENITNTNMPSKWDKMFKNIFNV